jgi:hypothetical protein
VDHGVHIARHLRELREVFGEAKVRALMSRCGVGLHSDGRLAVERSAGADDVFCATYLQAVRSELGDMAFRLALVNFTLAGCTAAAGANRAV